MSDKQPNNSYFHFPSLQKFPQLGNNSLKFINTINNFPIDSSAQLDGGGLLFHNQQEDDSLAERISGIHTASNSTKKKKSGCTCKKTLCLKMYCQCFSNNKYCSDDCACSGCRNLQIFKEQVSNAHNSVKEGGLRNCSLAEKRCNCKKSHCLKKYCECFNSGVGCTQSCKCLDCQNKEKEDEVKQQSEILNQEKQKKCMEIGISLYKSSDYLQRFDE